MDPLGFEDPNVDENDPRMYGTRPPILTAEDLAEEIAARHRAQQKLDPKWYVPEILAKLGPADEATQKAAIQSWVEDELVFQEAEARYLHEEHQLLAELVPVSAITRVSSIIAANLRPLTGTPSHSSPRLRQAITNLEKVVSRIDELTSALDALGDNLREVDATAEVLELAAHIDDIPWPPATDGQDDEVRIVAFRLAEDLSRAESPEDILASVQSLRTFSILLGPMIPSRRLLSPIHDRLRRLKRAVRLVQLQHSATLEEVGATKTSRHDFRNMALRTIVHSVLGARRSSDAPELIEFELLDGLCALLERAGEFYEVPMPSKGEAHAGAGRHLPANRRGEARQGRLRRAVKDWVAESRA